jgi:hypothetical protein
LWHHNTSRMHSGSKAHLSSQQLIPTHVLLWWLYFLSFRLGIFMISSWRYVDTNCITSSLCHTTEFIIRLAGYKKDGVALLPSISRSKLEESSRKIQPFQQQTRCSE